MPKENPAEQAIRAAAEEIGRETSAAVAEVRVELGAASRESRQALSEAMAEVRTAFADIWGSGESRAAPGSGGRMSRAQRKEMTRELLLDAAIDVFAEKGYHGASLDDVAEAAGFTKGAVYSNFTRKSDLFRALLERETRRTDDALRRVIEAVPLELLPDVAGELLRHPDPERSTQTLMVEFWLAGVRDPSLRQTLLAATDDLGEVLAGKLRAAGAQPGLDGRELAVILDALTTGLLMNQALDPDGDQPTLYAKAIHKLIGDEPAVAATEEPRSD
jgi:AcrR family transcriptional regulator